MGPSDILDALNLMLMLMMLVLSCCFFLHLSSMLSALFGA